MGQAFLKSLSRLRFRSWWGGLLLALPLLCGCQLGSGSSSQRELFDRAGRTYYIDGAGNWGYGVNEVQEGLRRAGYRGNVINFRWSFTFNPALDQTIGRVGAYTRAGELARQISAYLKEYPDNQVNLIALSAGTGVAVWACEKIEPPARVHTLILLGSSLSSRYDMRKALANIEGGVWVYFSPYDQILNGPVKAIGTIDGEIGADSAGLVGLHPRSGRSDKIHNIGWSARWERFGWGGAHTDATSEPFVRLELSKHIIAEPTEQVTATRQAETVADQLSPAPLVFSKTSDTSGNDGQAD